MNAATNQTGTYDKRSIKKNMKMVAWIFIWMVSLIVSDKAALYGWWSAEWITVLSIIINAGFGLGVVYGYRRMLKGMDDLQRKIQLEALSMAFGVSVIGSISYSLLVTWGYIIDEEVTDIFMLMSISFSASVLLNSWRYK